MRYIVRTLKNNDDILTLSRRSMPYKTNRYKEQCAKFMNFPLNIHVVRNKKKSSENKNNFSTSANFDCKFFLLGIRAARKTD